MTFDLGGREHETIIRLTAGGRLWHGVGGLPGFGAEILPAPGLLTGRFALRGLRPFEGGEERIDVTGNWRCPPEAD